MLQHPARIGLGIDDDQVWLQLRDAFGEVPFGRQRGDDVVARLQQPNSQGRAALNLSRRRGVAPDAFGRDAGDDDNAQLVSGR